MDLDTNQAVLGWVIFDGFGYDSSCVIVFYLLLLV